MTDPAHPAHPAHPAYPEPAGSGRDGFAVVPAAYLFLLRDAAGDTGGTGSTEVLLQRRRGTGYYDEHWAAGAAGHVERGETVLAAVRREAREEIGVGDLRPELVTVMQRTRRDRAIDERVDFFFTARSFTGRPRVREPHRSAELGWFALDALPDPVVPHELAVLTALRTHTLQPYTPFGFEEQP